MAGPKDELSVLTTVLTDCAEFKIVDAKLDQVTIAIDLQRGRAGTSASSSSSSSSTNETVNVAAYINSYPDQPPVFVVVDDAAPEVVERALEEVSMEADKTLVQLFGILYKKLGFDGDIASELVREYTRMVKHHDTMDDSESGNDSDEDGSEEEFDDIDDDDDDDDYDDDDDAMFELDELHIKPDRLENDTHQKLMDKLKDDVPNVKKQSLQATDRLMKELQQCYRSENVKKNVYSIELMDDNIKEWKIRIFQLDKDSNIMKSLKVLMEKFPEHNCVVIHASFTDEYPIKPPFFRVMSPLIQGGHVMSGGAICAEVLTSGGWSSAYSIDSLIVQVGQTIAKQSTISTKGTEALKYGQYTKTNASKSFSQLLKYHELKGWGKQKMSDG